jgi:hypothetical protein
MIYLKKWKSFFEDGDATVNTSTTGMGPVVNATVGQFAGVPGEWGSGDVSNFLGFDAKQPVDTNSKPLGKKKNKGNPSQVTDMRDLEPAKGVTKVEEIKESDIYISMRPRDPAYDPKTLNMINNCLVELLHDLNFELTMMDYNAFKNREELKISLNKKILQNWIGNYSIRCKFDDEEVTSSSFSTLRASGKEMNELEKELFDLVQEVSINLINNLDYQSGEFTIQWLVDETSMPILTDRKRNVNVNISFVLNNLISN